MLCISGFVDDVIFSHNGPNGSESKTTRMFRPVRYVAAPGGESAVSKKVKFSHTGYRALGSELILVYRQSARR